MWLCLKMGSENMVLVRLLQIGAKDLTVWDVPHGIFNIYCGKLFGWVGKGGGGGLLKDNKTKQKQLGRRRVA